MRTRFTFSHFLLALITFVVIASCDDHIDVIDTSIKVGHILCTDGHIMPVEEVKKQGKQPIAVVFYINENNDNPISDGIGLAAYLWDVEAQAFSDTLGIVQGTNCSTIDYAGNANSFAMYSNKNAYSPIAQTVINLWSCGRSCYIPSLAEMRLMYERRNIINTYSTLSGGNSIDPYSFYWTSTEVDGQATAKAWTYSLGSGSAQEAPKTNEYKIRPIITIHN